MDPHGQDNEAQRADSTYTDKHIIEPDALRLSRLNNDSTDDENGETMTPEQERIDRLMDVDDLPHNIEVQEESSGADGTLPFNEQRFLTSLIDETAPKQQQDLK